MSQPILHMLSSQVWPDYTCHAHTIEWQGSSGRSANLDRQTAISSSYWSHERKRGDSTTREYMKWNMAPFNHYFSLHLEGWPKRLRSFTTDWLLFSREIESTLQCNHGLATLCLPWVMPSCNHSYSASVWLCSILQESIGVLPSCGRDRCRISFHTSLIAMCSCQCQVKIWSLIGFFLASLV